LRFAAGSLRLDPASLAAETAEIEAKSATVVISSSKSDGRTNIESSK
jgi:hypothetical protein